MKKVLQNIIRFLIIILFTCTSGCLIYYVYKLNVLNIKYFIILGIIIFLFWLLIILNLIRKKAKTGTKIFVGIIAIILSAIYFFGLRYADQTIKFVSNMTQREYEIQEYYVLVLNNSPYSHIKDLENKKIGFLSIGANIDKSKSQLHKKINYGLMEYQNTGELILAIENGNVDAIVLDESFVELLRENKSPFIGESKVIYTYSLKIKGEYASNKVDVNEDAFVLYISGSDSRTGIKTIARSDVNILAVVNPKKNKILLVTVPRDYYVQLHGTTGTLDKLTHAGLYGLEMSKNTIQDLLGVDINYSIKVSFSTLIKVVDVLDGIEIYSDKSFMKKTLDGKKCYFNKGYQKVTGECALAFSRERFVYETGDIHRGQNQQVVLSAIIKKLSDPKYLIRYNDMLKAIDGSFETDMSYDDITSLVKNQLTNLNNWTIESIGLTGPNDMRETYSMGKQKLYVFLQDPKSINNAKTKIVEYLK